MTQIDNELTVRWQKILQGDTHEFAEFVDQNKNLITSIAYSMVGDLASSEDIAQETFLCAWQSRHELLDPEKVVGWLSGIARNLSKQWVRKRSSRSWAAANLDSSNLPQESPHPSERLVSGEEQQLVWSALEAIPESCREVMILYYRESHSITEVAIALEITEEAARQRLSRGRNLLRTEVERTIESALTLSRPSANFTSSVMSLVAAGWGSMAAKTASAASAGLIGKTATQGTLLAATQTTASGAVIGAAGGVLGAFGGLLGTWLGIRVPQLMAPTMTERKLLEREGKVTWRLSLGFLFASLASVAVALLTGPSPDVILWVVIGNLAVAMVFAVTCIVRGLRMNRVIKQLRNEISPEEDPNPTWLKDRLGVSNRPGESRWVGRRKTSQLRLWGWPIYDFQISDPGLAQINAVPLHAKGWLAVGDKATGFIAVGNIARGFFALGGMTLGVVSLGGLAVGLLSVGGLSLGLLTMGGLAIGHSAMGGGAIGWQAVGGGALGIYSANGGLAVAGNIAEGGQAISLKYAVGEVARAPEANTELARSECGKSWMSKYMGSQVIINDQATFHRNIQIYGMFIPIGVSVMFALILPMLMYRKVKDH